MPSVATMSTGNGEARLDYDDAARLAKTLGRTLPLSAAERDRQREVYVAAVDNIANVLRVTVRQVDALIEENRVLRARVDAVERGAQVLSAWVRRPFWERVRARVGL